MADASFPLGGRRVWVAGHNGMVGSALIRRLQQEQCEILTAERDTLDLRRQKEVEDWLYAMRPDAAFLAAAHVGGILANSSYPADFLYDTLAIEIATIEAARKSGVKKLLFLGSSCIYPRLAPQPIHEEALLTGPLEPSNQWYAIAKIAGLKMMEAYRLQHGCDFISAMPTNLYGPGDNFDLASSHVVPALLRKAHEAKQSKAGEMIIWGTGKPRREFLYVDDCADALVFLMKNYSDQQHVNIGSGKEITILALAELIADCVGFSGKIRTDTSKPDGTVRKLISSSYLDYLGWRPGITLKDGIAHTYKWFLNNIHAQGAPR